VNGFIDSVDVVIPAANEAKSIRGCLDAVSLARRRFHSDGNSGVHVRALVVLDRCFDATEEIADRYADWVEVIHCEAGNVGIARAMGCAQALTRVPPPRTWLANTDADSRVPPDWICRMVGEARKGVHVVLGTVQLDERASVDCRLIWQAAHSVSEGHPHIHGANFGVRGDIYLQLGGWPPLASGEDVELARRASITPALRVTRTAQIPVVTSTRSIGRAPNGFAGYLRDLGIADRGDSTSRRKISP
jgi:cellulose synthase/poly-beta-1,6-N-acetylglucosamine synthase-like glycosyltransferase